jgi:hypothetical protein
MAKRVKKNKRKVFWSEAGVKKTIINITKWMNRAYPQSTAYEGMHLVAWYSLTETPHPPEQPCRGCGARTALYTLLVHLEEERIFAPDWDTLNVPDKAKSVIRGKSYRDFFMLLRLLDNGAAAAMLRV